MNKIQYVLMDVDGTMTGYLKPDPQIMTLSPLTHLENLVMKKHSVSREEAHRRICSCGNMEIQCLSEFLPQLEIDPQDYFQVIVEDLRHLIYVTEDTIRFFHYLRKKNIGLYTATTNPPFMTRAKLSLGGLADIDKCPLLTGYFPGCMFKDPEGKYSASYYPNILKHGKFDPECVMMIGDEPIRDMLPALRAGIRYGVTINRQQKEEWFRKDGGVYVNSLDVLTDLMEKQLL